MNLDKLMGKISNPLNPFIIKRLLNIDLKIFNMSLTEIFLIFKLLWLGNCLSKKGAPFIKQVRLCQKLIGNIASELVWVSMMCWPTVLFFEGVFIFEVVWNSEVFCISEVVFIIVVVFIF